MQTRVYMVWQYYVSVSSSKMSVLIFRGVSWNQLMRQNAQARSLQFIVMVGLAVGHLVGSFMIEMTESYRTYC